MSTVLAGIFLVVVISIAADFRVLNALICLTKSLFRALNPVAKGKTND